MFRTLRSAEAFLILIREIIREARPLTTVERNVVFGRKTLPKKTRGGQGTAPAEVKSNARDLRRRQSSVTET